MSERLGRVLRRIANYPASYPMHVVEIILALSLFVFGFFVLTPFYYDRLQEWVQCVLGLGYIFSSGPLLLLTLLRKSTEGIRKKSQFAMFFAFCFIFLQRLIVYGFDSFLWIFPLVLAVISSVAYLRLGLDRHNAI